jgi:hypothetical protein
MAAGEVSLDLGAQGPTMSTWAFFMERVTRTELALSAWEATALAPSLWL